LTGSSGVCEGVDFGIFQAGVPMNLLGRFLTSTMRIVKLFLLSWQDVQFTTQPCMDAQ